ncbi:MAG: type IV secretion system protein [Candidatus Peregrinibacteria bacterium]
MIVPLWIQKLGQKLITTLLTVILTLGFFTGIRFALAQENPLPDEPSAPITFEATGHQTVELQDVAGPEWKKSEWLTGGLKFLVRGREALSWVIGIDNAGFDNPALNTSYTTVLTIVNSLFILGLLAIAAMWMFSLLIPRQQLKRVILVYVFAVIFVNFALPVNRLLIDGANLLQKTLLTRGGNPIGIVDIVDAPTYANAVGYENQLGKTTETETQNLRLSIPDNSMMEVPVGTVNPEAAPVTIGGTLSGVSGGTLDLRMQSSAPRELNLKTNQPINLKLESSQEFNPHREQEWFSFGLVVLTGLAYLLMALIFMARLVILWGLLILSPALLLLGVFKATRGYFLNWLSVYGRWLLIGPLIALGLSVVVNVWQAVGLPLTSTAPSDTFGVAYNLKFYLPGSATPNDLSTTSHMMQYLLFLMMLYLPLFFGFALTRQKHWAQAATAITENVGRIRRDKSGASAVAAGEPATPATPQPGGWTQGIRTFLGEKIGQFTQAALPSRQPLIRETEGARPIIPSASNFLPEQLALHTVPELMGLLGTNQESRHSREQTLEKLAAPQLIADPVERKNVMAVREEIETRASHGEPEAVIIKNEIQTHSETAMASAAPTNSPAVNVQVQTQEQTSATEKPQAQSSATEPLRNTGEPKLEDEDDTMNREAAEKQKNQSSI